MIRTRLVFLCILPVAGCVTFERETIVVVATPDGKETRALLVYEGIRVQGDKEEDLKEARGQLKRLPASRYEFCLGSPALHVNLYPDRQGETLLRATRAEIARHLLIKGGGFFESKEGKLCAYQTITLRDRAGFVQDLNEATSNLLLPVLAMRLADPQRREAFWDDEALRRLVLACTARYAWWELEPGRLRFSLPTSPAVADRLKRDLFRPDRFAEARKRIEGAEKDRADDCLRFLARVGPILSDNAWSIEQRPDRLSVALGFGEGKPLRIVVQNEPATPYRLLDRQLVDYARTLKAPFHQNLTAEGLVEEFIKKNGVLK